MSRHVIILTGIIVRKEGVQMQTKNEITTEWLKIYKNILEWDKNMVQLSNIAQVSAKEIELEEFPKWTAIAIVLGIMISKVEILMGILIIGVSVWGIYSWAAKNRKLKEQTVLSIRLNGGNTIYFNFYNKEFLEKVWETLKNIIADGNKKDADIIFNIKDNTMTGNASIFSNATIG